VDLQETRLEETEGVKLSAFKMTAQYPYLKDAPEPGAAKGRKAAGRRPGAKPAAGKE